MKKIFQGLSLGFIALALVVSAGAGVASADLTIGATSVTTDGAYTLNGVAGSVYAFGAATTTGTITIGGTAQTGTITLGSSSGNGTIDIGAGAGVTTVQLGVGGGADVITIGDADANVSVTDAQWSISAAGAGTLASLVSPTVTAATSVTVGGSGTAITQVRVYSPSLTPAASSAAVQTAEQTFTVSGLTTADKVFVNGPAPTSLCPAVTFRVSAADTLAIGFSTLTAAACTPAAGTYNIVAVRS